MIGISPKLPLSMSPDGGHTLNQNHADAAAQNFKNLVLTAPGERVMDPLFGVGLRNYLFENYTPLLRDEIIQKIMAQVDAYMPFIEIQRVEVTSNEDTRAHTATAISLRIVISYRIIPLNIVNVLAVSA